jgi:uncharacterized paraquat-inducible protein A
MPIASQCPSCAMQLAIPETAAGGQARCPRCMQVFAVPALAPVSIVSPPPIVELEPAALPLSSRLLPLAWWFLAASILAALCVTIFVAVGEPYKAMGSIPVCWIAVGLFAVIHYTRTPCPSCERRWAGSRWLHANQDGGPDRRHKENALLCSGCGHVLTTVVPPPMPRSTRARAQSGSRPRSKRRSSTWDD